MRGRKKDARDVVLEKVEGAHRGLVQLAGNIARKLAIKNGRVSSPEVWRALWDKAAHDEELRQELEKADPRWMGAVFNHYRWHRVGWEANGSHKRPVSVWELQPELVG